MHDLRWFCSRSNFLNRPTLIFARLSTGFLENRTVFGGSFSHVRSKKPLTFPCNGQIRACHGHVCLCSQIIVNLRKLDFSIGDPSVYSTLKVIGKNLYQLKKFWLFLLNVSFKLTTRRAADDAVKKVKARHPAVEKWRWRLIWLWKASLFTGNDVLETASGG